jgi:hypothetical protein
VTAFSARMTAATVLASAPPPTRMVTPSIFNLDLDDAVGLVPPTSALSLGRFTNALRLGSLMTAGTNAGAVSAEGIT